MTSETKILCDWPRQTVVESFTIRWEVVSLLSARPNWPGLEPLFVTKFQVCGLKRSWDIYGGGGGGGTKYPPPLVGIGLARIQGLAHIQVSADEVKKAFCSVPKKTATGPERIYLSKRLDQMLGRCAPCSTSHWRRSSVSSRINTVHCPTFLQCATHSLWVCFLLLLSKFTNSRCGCSAVTSVYHSFTMVCR